MLIGIGVTYAAYSPSDLFDIVYAYDMPRAISAHAIEAGYPGEMASCIGGIVCPEATGLSQGTIITQ
jgi:hypothetical protein